MNNPLPKDSSATDFAQYIAENKPYLIEIEEEIQKMGKFGEMDIKISIRGGRVEKVSFWKGRTWLLDRSKLTQSNP
jgi:hypothetical protein